MRVTLVLAILSLAAAAAADPPTPHKIKVVHDLQPVRTPSDRADLDARIRERENAAASDLSDSMTSGKARDVAARFATPLDYADVRFPRDAACAQKFHEHGYLKKKADVVSFAACLATAPDAFAAGTLRVELDANSGRISRIWVQADAERPDVDAEGEDNGVVGGMEGGVDDGVLGPPPPPPARPVLVAPTALNASRISGQTAIVPDDATKASMVKAKQTRLIGSVKLCLKSSGAIESVVLVKSTGYAAYDKRIVDTVRTWKYRPYTVNGAATAVCTAIMLIYSQS